MKRTPDGKFGPPEAMLAAWLPWLLDKAWSNQIEDVLALAERWCRLKAAHYMHQGSECLKQTDDPTWEPTYHIEKIQQWLETAKLLRETARKVSAIWAKAEF